jgi:hypothetical protein
MATIEYKDPSFGITVAFDIPTSILEFNFSGNIWLSIARCIIKAIDKILLTPVKSLVFQVNRFREDIIVEWEKSKARIKANKLIAVAIVYEQKKLEVEKFCFTTEAKQKLIARLDRALDMQLEQIIEYS